MSTTPREVIREREKKIWQLRQSCLTTRQIAEAVGVSQPTVCRALARVEGRVLADLGAQMISLKAQQSLQLENLASQSYLAWEASKKVGKAPGMGDPRYLSETRAALADLRRVWGIDSPDRLELSGKGGRPIAISSPGAGQADHQSELDRVASILLVLDQAGALGKGSVAETSLALPDPGGESSGTPE